MAHVSRDAERQKLVNQITEWNANRLDLFELSLPDESLEFHGVMRFFFQDDGSKVATKCIRVAGSASTADVIETLVEKFRPDMRMLSLPSYSLYEVHVNGEERKLQKHERPLFVQLNWGKDDREGRFLLKREDVRTAPLPGMAVQPTATTEDPPPMKRKLSKREKKELKKKEKEAKLKGKENESPEGVAEKLYNDLPDTSFTRTISNPEVVMRRRRQQKLEKKLQEIRSKDDQGGTLKIYGESIRPDVPYKTLLLSAQDPAWFVVKETLEKYGMEKEDPSKYCLIQVLIPPEGNEFQGKQMVLDDEDCPLDILMHHPPTEGIIMFQLRRRTADMPPAKRKKKKGGREEDPQAGFDPRDPRAGPPPERLPFLVEINPDGSEPYKAIRHRLPPNVTEVGSDKNVASGAPFLKLLGPDIHPRHCVLAHYDAVVTVTPTNPNCTTYVNNQQIFETTMLQHGMVLRFGKMHMFRFCDPVADDRRGPPHMNEMQKAGPPPQGRPGPPGHDPANFETTFDVDGHIETHGDGQGPPAPTAGRDGPPPPGQGRDMPPQSRDMPPPSRDMPPQGRDMPPKDPRGQPYGEQQFGGPPPGPMEDELPASLEFRDEGEAAFLAALISEVNGAAVQFKLAPTYSLYMALRFRLSPHYRAPADPSDRLRRVVGLVGKLAHTIHATIQDNRNNAGGLSFWMANASEMLHFCKADRELGALSVDAQDVLAEAVQAAFSHLVACMQDELRLVMPNMLNPNNDEHLDNEVLGVLSSAMSLLRKCRVNAALTIQLFSQLFHFLNMWLFNELVLGPPQAQLCTRVWGQRLKRRLARVEGWAEKQGLELAADCHLARIIQAAHLLEAPKSSSDDIAALSSACFKLNSLQLRALLQNYIPAPGEPRVPPQLVDNIVTVAQNTADELTRSDGRPVQLAEDADLQLPFLLPEDGYSCEIIKGLPSGLPEFLDPLAHSGLCRLNISTKSSGMWTVYMSREVDQNENLRGAGNGSEQQPPAQPTPAPGGFPKDAETIYVTFPKVNGSMGLSIVAAKGEGQKEKGIYVKSVVPRGAAALDGRLQAGDQLIEVDGKSLIGLSQEKAAEYMTQTGKMVTLRVVKQGAIYHGLATLLSQPSPTMPNRESPSGPAPMPPPPQQKPRPKSEDVSRFAGGPPGPRQDPMGPPMGQKPLNMQHGAQSSPALAPQDPRAEPPYSRGPPQQPQPQYGQPRHPDSRSKSTSNLDRPDDYRGPGSSATLPRPQQHQQQPPPGGPGGPGHFLSQPDLHRPGEQHPDYENYPSGPGKPPRLQQQQQQQQPGPQADYVNQRELKNNMAYNKEPVRPSQSMSNMREEPAGRGGDLTRPISEESLEHVRVREWQQRNELAAQQEQWPPEDIPRTTANNQQYQQGFFYGTQPRDQDLPPPFNRMQAPPEDPRLRQGPPKQQPPPSKPPVMQQEMPRVDAEAANRQRQQNFYDPHKQGAQGAPSYPPSSQGYAAPPNQGYPPNSQGYPPSSQGYPPTSQGYPPHSQGYPPNSQGYPPSSQGYPPSSQGYPPTSQGYPGARFQRDKQSPLGRVDANRHPQGSPELPPPPSDIPPELPPPPQDLSGSYGDEPPPPPPPPAEGYEPQDPSMLRPQDRYNQQQQPSPHSPNYQNYQNLPGPSGRPVYTQAQSHPAEPQQHYPYQPRPAPAAKAHFTGNRPDAPESQFNGNQPPPQQRPPPQQQQQQRPPGPGRPTDSLPRQPPPGQRPVPAKKPPPPINPKPKLIAAEIAELQKKANSPSPWEREQKQREIDSREDELRRLREEEIAELETRHGYLSPEEQERLKRLRLDHEFDRRMQEVNSKEEDDDDITESAAGRVRVLKMMQDDAEKKSRDSERDMHTWENRQDMGEFEKIQRNERKLAQFEREREEQKQRQLRRQEKRAQETENYLQRQREQRDKERQEQEERARQQKAEEDRTREMRQEEQRRKKELQEREPGPSLREGDAGDKLTKQRFLERLAEREAQMKKEKARERERQQQQQQQPPQRYDAGPPSYRPSPPPATAPKPPERNSSYDIYSKAGGNLSAAAAGLYDGQNTSRPGSTIRPAPAPLQPPMYDSASPSKKNVSFHSDLTTETHYIQRRFTDSVSSDSSYPQTPQTPPGQYPEYNGGPPQQQQQQQQQQPPFAGYLPPGANNDVFEMRTPEPQQQQAPPQLISGDTPGVVGAQEVYRDPRDRMLAARQGNRGGQAPQSAERMSFRDKMKLFANEIGENTPQEKSKSSRAQQNIESQLTSP